MVSCCDECDFECCNLFRELTRLLQQRRNRDTPSFEIKRLKTLVSQVTVIYDLPLSTLHATIVTDNASTALVLNHVQGGLP